ncbi:MAG TPA: HEAT repeat domain-containing protein, partial [Planctomycetota bacterium]|nr:HEAT repeat domain-containing protein [Planctomycetota bacterium]
GTPEAVDVLVRLAREGERDRSPALERLARIDARAAAPALARVLHEEPPGPLLVAATRALGRTRVRAYVLDISRLVRSPPAEAAVAPLDATRDAAIDSVMEDVLLAAVEALGLIADPDGIPALERALASPSARVRRTAVRALGKIRAPAAIRVLESFALSTEVERERSLAEDALARLAGEPGGPFSRADR